MNKFSTISLVICFLSISVFAQKSINSYKYILVPKQFEFQKSEDQYQLNSLTKFLFKRANYTVLFTDESYPKDLAKNNCLALRTVVGNNSSALTTKITINLYDCNNNIVFSTKEGRSKEKEYKKAYQEAIRKAFVELEELNYVYDGTSLSIHKNKVVETETVVVQKKKEIKVFAAKPISKEVKQLKKKPKVVFVKNTKEQRTTPIKIKKELAIKTIEGTFSFDTWGVSTISKKGDTYSVVGGDKNFEFATIYSTSKPTLFIIKWATHKQPQLLEIDNEGNLKIDAENGIRVYKRIN